MRRLERRKGEVVVGLCARSFHLEIAHTTLRCRLFAALAGQSEEVFFFWSYGKWPRRAPLLLKFQLSPRAKTRRRDSLSAALTRTFRRLHGQSSALHFAPHRIELIGTRSNLIGPPTPPSPSALAKLQYTVRLAH
jgi:hypothetical protein